MIHHVPLTSREIGPDRRQYKWLRSIVAWFLDSDPDTLEKFVITLQGGAALAVAALSSRVVATPPPWWRGFILVLPAWAWAALIVLGAIHQIRARDRRCWRGRHKWSLYSLAVCCLLCGPLWLRAPGLCSILGVLVLFQAVLAGHLSHSCKRAGQGN